MMSEFWEKGVVGSKDPDLNDLVLKQWSNWLKFYFELS